MLNISKCKIDHECFLLTKDIFNDIRSSKKFINTSVVSLENYKQDLTILPTKIAEAGNSQFLSHDQIA